MTLMGIESTDDHDDVRNQYEQKLFEWKQDFLQKYMVPALVKKKFSLLDEYVAAEKSLFDINGQASTDSEHPVLIGESRIGMLEHYEALISAQKLVLMNAPSFSQLAIAARRVVHLQEDYMRLFPALFSEYSEALPEEVNSREMIDTGKLLFALKHGELDNKILWAIEREITRIKKIKGIL